MDGYLCAGSLSHLEDNRSVATVKCPLTGAIYERTSYEGKTCPTCNLVTLGQDAIGLNI